MKVRRGWLLPALLIFAALLSALATYHASGNLLDADASSELVLAKRLFDTGRILSDEWYYSTELRVLNTQLVYAPLFFLFDDWRMVRFMGAMILQGLMVGAYGYFVKKARLGRDAFFLGGALLLLPAGVAYGRIALYHGYYAPHIALGFWIAGMFLSAAEAERGGVRAARLAGLTVLSLLSGLGGIRQGVITQLPLLALTALRMLSLEKKHGRLSGLIKECRGELCAALAACAGFAAGYLVNAKVLSEIYDFRSYSSVGLTALSAGMLDELAYGFLHQFGFRWDVKAISLMGVLSLGGLAAGLVCAAEAAAAALRPDGGEALGQFAAKRMFPACACVMLCVFLFSDSPNYYPLYMIPMGVWAVPMLAARLEEERGVMRRLILSLAAAAMLISGLGNVGFVLSPERFSQPYEGLFWQDARTVKKISGAADFLTENGCALGYADSWSANLITELTDGAVRMIPLALDEEDNRIDYNDWLTVKTLRDEPVEKPYVVMRADAVDACMNARGSEYMNKVYDDGYYSIYWVENLDQFRGILSE